MPRRTKDWLRQAERDLAHSKADLKGRYYEWVCFSAQQAAEKALKAGSLQHYVGKLGDNSNLPVTR